MMSTYMIFYWFVTFISLYLLVFWLLTYLDKESAKPLVVKSLKKFPLVSIAIPAYNEEKRIKKTILSVLNLDYPSDKIELFVMDDGSSDGTKKVVEKIIKEHKDRNIKLVSKPNRGKGAVLNIALKMAKGEYFVVFDADSTVGKNALMEMLPTFSIDKDTACVLPAIKVRDPFNSLLKYQWIEYLVTFFYKYIMDFVDCIPVSPGPFSVYKKKDIDEIGGFDEDNLTEDLELSLNLQKHHKRIRQNNKVVVETSAPETWKSFYKQRNRWYKGGFYNTLKYRSMIFNKQYGDFGLLQFPAFFAMGWLVLVLMMIGIVKLVSNIYDFFINLYDINFDILHFIDFSGFWWFSIEYANILLMIFATTTLMVLLFSAINHHEEKLFKEKWILLPLYLVVYGLFLVFVWLGILIDMIFGKKQKW